MDVTPSIMPTTRLEKYDVVNLAGEDLGQVQNFMLDMSYGRIAFLVVAFGGTLGFTDKWFALPWDIMAWSPEVKKFIMNAPREVLESAPGIDKKKWPYEIDVSWLTRCYAHYGCNPYWTKTGEEETKKLAYSIWEQEDRPDGKHLEHYYRAEKILAHRAADVNTPEGRRALKVH
jgi:sporulation protein YlmC with PRC-barrel domain